MTELCFCAGLFFFRDCQILKMCYNSYVHLERREEFAYFRVGKGNYEQDFA